MSRDEREEVIKEQEERKLWDQKRSESDYFRLTILFLFVIDIVLLEFFTLAHFVFWCIDLKCYFDDNIEIINYITTRHITLSLINRVCREDPSLFLSEVTIFDCVKPTLVSILM